MTPFQQLQFSFNQFLSIVRPSIEDIEFLERADKVEYFKFQERYVLKIAEVVMCCEPFANLPFNDKVRGFYERYGQDEKTKMGPDNFFLFSLVSPLLVASIPPFLVFFLCYWKGLFELRDFWSRQWKIHYWYKICRRNAYPMVCQYIGSRKKRRI